MSRRSGPRVAILSAVLTLVIGGVGLIAMLILNAFVFDDYNAYGEVSIPGSTSLQLPAGEVTVNFHTMVTGSPSSGFPIPDLKFNVTPPAGVAKPQVTESIGGTTTVNSDTHVQVWVMQIPQGGTYDIETDGNINGYINPHLAFGHGSSYGWLTWVFGGLLAFGVVELVVALMWSARSAKRARPLAPEELLSFDEPTASPAPLHSLPNYTPSDQGVRLEQLKELAALRDSGALTEDEFEAEKRRILES
ncbi:SHOCT domain-containing protein [Mycolicibacterium moriokaense]|uniref:Putative oligomerization/nucleic acid binding protein n=1 Tax=Mycolicibacterium moriokaense TaxID=39691 RepID=A0A318HP37_9MYCO|nr:SHOCT domain-containing protein [Mycolicibacterium moriokaense]PXX10279.1 putative oligomerization/nucleic acid binding protein [Mycolicibacterium moriokaense]